MQIFASSLPPRRARFAILGAGALALATTAICWQPHRVAAQQTAAPAPASAEFYTKNVQPIFAASCFRCHAGLNHRGGFNMDRREGFLHAGKHGNIVTPGKPDESLLLKLIRHEGPAEDPRPMPPRGPKISDADIATVTQWIQAGAIMPAEAAKE